MRILHKAIEFGAPISDLILLYIQYVRNHCEKSCVVWNSLITKDNSTDIERVQKTALRIIYKSNYIDYENALKISGLEPLSERRKNLCLKFAKGCLKNEDTKDMFPLKNVSRTREPEIFEVFPANTSRMQNSPIIYMQHLLNGISHIYRNAQ